MKILHQTIYALVMISLMAACTNNELPLPDTSGCTETPTYSVEIKPIIDNSCSYDGCHVAGFGSGDFSNYNNLQIVLNSGSFKDRVVDQANMPPNNAPAGRPTELTDEEMTLIECWLAEGFPE